MRHRSRSLEPLSPTLTGSLIACTVALFGACSDGTVSPPPVGGPSRPPGYAIANIAVEEIPDPVAEVYWILTFDAEWTGSGVPVPVRCKWTMDNATGKTIIQGGVEVHALHGENLIAGDVYPDEIPGRPVTGEITCPTP